MCCCACTYDKQLASSTVHLAIPLRYVLEGGVVYIRVCWPADFFTLITACAGVQDGVACVSYISHRDIVESKAKQLITQLK